MSEENKSRLYGAIWHHMDAATIAGFGPWVRHADHVAEIERLRAKLASAKEVIAPFAERYREAMRVKAAKHAVSTNAKVSDLRAAAEWMEKGDE